MKLLLRLCLLTTFVTGCTHSVHQVALGNFDDLPPGARMHPVEVEADQSVFIASGNTDFADQALQRLAASCPRGQVVGIQARYSTSLGFLAYTNKLKLNGYCVDVPPTVTSG